jgi:hypothetical protein
VFGHQLVEQGDEDVLLAAEVEVDGPVRDARALRDLGHARREVALAREHLHRRLQDAPPLSSLRFRANRLLNPDSLSMAPARGVKPGGSGPGGDRR